jgi:hypothetical protein
MNSKHDLYIAAPGLPVQELKLLITALKVLYHDGMNFHMQNETSAKVHLLVLDGDTPNGQQLLQASREGQVKLLISTHPTRGKNIIGLSKPLKIHLLAGLLKKLFIKMQQQLSQRKRITQSSVVNEKREIGGNKTLFSLLLEVKTQKNIARISCTPYPDIFADGLNRSLVTSASHEQIKEIINRPFEEMVVDYLPGSDFAVHKSAMNVSTLHHILWISGLQNSNGKIIQDHNIDQPVKLRAWPNFTRNDFKAEHLKLAALMARHAISITELAKLSNVSLEEVINFYNAAFAVDLIDFTEQTASQPVRQSSNSHKQHSLLTKIANRLSLWK